MNCEQVQHILDDYFDGTLDMTNYGELKRHLARCDQCQQKVDDHHQFLDVLNAQPVPEMSSGYALNMIKKAQSQAQKNHWHKQKRFSFIQGFAAAMVLAVIGLVVNDRLHDYRDLEPTSTLASESQQGLRYTEVNVVIFVPEDMDNVALALYLPDGLSMDDFSETQFVAWTTDLSQGANQISLPVIIEPGVDIDTVKTLMASITYKNKTKEFQLNVDLSAVRDEQAELNRLNTPFNPSV